MLQTIEIPAKLTAKDTDNEVQAAAKVWLAAKVVEDAAKEAKQDRSTAESILCELLTDKDTVTMNGNMTYKWGESVRSRANDRKILAAVEVLHPGVTATIERLKREDKEREVKLYASPYTVCSLKPAAR